MSSTYNLTRWTRQILKRNRNQPPSLILHLYPSHFRFEKQNGVFLFDSPMKVFCEYIREQRLPTDLLDVIDDAGIKYYDGCLIVEVRDHRPNTSPSRTSSANAFNSWSVNRAGHAGNSDGSPTKMEAYRIALGPTADTIWTDLALLCEDRGGSWTDEEAVEMEAKILSLTTHPLCLAPSIQVSRIANSMLSATTFQPTPSKKRKTRPSDVKEAAQRQAQREQMMRIMDESFGRPFVPSFGRMSVIEQFRERRKMAEKEKANALLQRPGQPNGASAPSSQSSQAPNAHPNSGLPASSTATATEAAPVQNSNAPIPSYPPPFPRPVEAVSPPDESRPKKKKKTSISVSSNAASTASKPGDTSAMSPKAESAASPPASGAKGGKNGGKKNGNAKSPEPAHVDTPEEIEKKKALLKQQKAAEARKRAKEKKLAQQLAEKEKANAMQQASQAPPITSASLNSSIPLNSTPLRPAQSFLPPNGSTGLGDLPVGVGLGGPAPLNGNGNGQMLGQNMLPGYSGPGWQ